VPVGELSTEPGMVVHRASNRRISYGEIASFATVPAELPEIAEADLKPRDQWRYIGKDLPRRDVPSKVDGSAQFGIDVQVPGMVYAAVMQTSVAALFAAGIVPGLIMAMGLMALSYSISKTRGYSVRGQRASGTEVLGAAKKAVIPLMMPVIILVGILGGVFTPTEAAAVAVAYGLIVGFAGRWLHWRSLGKVFSGTIITSAMIMLIIACARLMGWMLVIENIPQRTGEFLLALTTNRYVYLLIVNLFLFVVGMFMDPGVAIIVLGPILEPVAVKLGVHPLHFAIVMVTNLAIAQLTPPVGYVLYVASSVAGISLDRLVRAVWPFILVEAAVCFLITYVPILPMSVPMLLGYYR